MEKSETRGSDPCHPVVEHLAAGVFTSPDSACVGSQFLAKDSSRAPVADHYLWGSTYPMKKASVRDPPLRIQEDRAPLATG
jgi:hypothetical protein